MDSIIKNLHSIILQLCKAFYKYKTSVSNSLIPKLNTINRYFFKLLDWKIVKRWENVNIKTWFYYKLLNSRRICKGHHSSQVKCQAIF